jgi:shikimate kinase
MMHGKSLVYIIGFMGSGKSTAGKKLAAALGWEFIDLDRKIEAAAGKSINEIFLKDGEDKFRSLETEVLRSLQTHVKTIVSTGGGTPCHADNMQFMLNTGVTVYLKMTTSQLVSRLKGSTGERPVLKNVPDDKLYGFIDEKLAIREKFYSKANIIIEGINLDINNLQSIIKLGAGI